MKSPIPLHEFESSATVVEEAVTLPPAAYTSPSFYEFELDAIWDRGWICVGRADQIPEPGDYYTTNIVGDERVIVVRDREGQIHVMSDVCQHRGMCVTAPAKRDREEWFDSVPDARGTTRLFRCPYHWWTYDLDGRLVGAPDMNHRADFDRSEIQLPQLRVEQWQGFIFATFDPDVAPLASGMAKVDEVLAHYDLPGMVSTPHEVLRGMPFNWKLMAENFMEGYHNSRLHQDLYDIDRADDPGGETSLRGRKEHVSGPEDGALLAVARTAMKDRGLNPTQRGLFPPIATLTDEERWHSLVMYVPPSLLSIVSTDSALWFVLTPTGPETVDMAMSYLHPRSTKDLKLFEALFAQQVSGVGNFNDEDLPASCSTQRGLRSRFAPRGALAKGDLFLAEFSCWLLDRYREAELRSC